MSTVHQIWLGGNMPLQEQQWTEGVRRGALEAGLDYKLWQDADIQAAFGDEPGWKFFQELLEVAPRVQVLTLMSDYYRFRVMARDGGLYLDTDYMLNGPLPSFRPGDGILCAGEFWRASAPCTAFLCGSAAAYRPVATEADKQLQEAVDEAAWIGAEQWWQQHGGRGILLMWGPKWYRAHGLPAAQHAGVEVRMVPRQVVGHVQWGPGSALTHVGTAHWH